MQNTQTYYDPFDFPLQKLPEELGKYKRGLLLGQTYNGFLYSGLNTETNTLVNLIHIYKPFVSLLFNSFRISS